MFTINTKVKFSKFTNLDNNYKRVYKFCERSE